MSEHPDAEQLLALAFDDARGDDGHGTRAHVARCPTCAARLREHRAMFVLLDASHQLPAVPSALRARVVAGAAAARRPASVWTKLAIFLAVLGSGLLAWHEGMHGHDSAQRASELFPNLHVHCLAFQAGFAAIPLVVGMALTRAGKARLDPLAYSAWSMGFALLAQVALRDRCEAPNLTLHLFAVHFTGVLLAGLIAGGIGRTLQPARTV